jgi:hypothetical protein
MLSVEGESEGRGKESVLVLGVHSIIPVLLYKVLWKGTSSLGSSFV